MNVLYDVRYAVRSLARQPGFTAAVIATLALGLGLKTGVFAAGYGVLWWPLRGAGPPRVIAAANVDSIAGARLQLAPVTAVAGLALAVAMVGLFGTLGRAVAERRRELSIRAALGGAPRSLVGLVLRDSLAIAAVGLVAGLAAAAGSGRGLSSLLYGVSSYDPLTFAGVAGVVLAATLVAAIVPARRAARIDSLIAVKED